MALGKLIINRVTIDAVRSIKDLNSSKWERCSICVRSWERCLGRVRMELYRWYMALWTGSNGNIVGSQSFILILQIMDGIADRIRNFHDCFGRLSHIFEVYLLHCTWYNVFLERLWDRYRKVYIEIQVDDAFFVLKLPYAIIWPRSYCWVLFLTVTLY